MLFRSRKRACRNEADFEANMKLTTATEDDVLDEYARELCGEFTRFSNPEDDMVIPMPGETVGPMLGSKMNRDSVGSVPPPPAPDFEPQSGNPFATPIGGDGPLPF